MVQNHHLQNFLSRRKMHQFATLCVVRHSDTQSQMITEDPRAIPSCYTNSLFASIAKIPEQPSEQLRSGLFGPFFCFLLSLLRPSFLCFFLFLGSFLILCSALLRCWMSVSLCVLLRGEILTLKIISQFEDSLVEWRPTKAVG